jgi:methylase of polypeptide subunit release factors
MNNYPTISWTDADIEHNARWRAESNVPARVVVIDDRMTADAAYRLACEGTGLLWRGDYQNARQLMQAMARRADDKPKKTKAASATEAFHLHRQSQAQRARTLNMLLLPLNSDHSLPLRRAPDVQLACLAAYGVASEPYILSLRGLLGIIGAHEWRKNGVEIQALAGRIHPHYGVFSPIRGEYVALVNEAPLPESTDLAFEIGTGTGVLAAVLARRGFKRIIATDLDTRALACARENLDRLGLTAQVEVIQADLYPEGRAQLIVCNPPWIPARPSSTLEYAIFDPESRMLKGFLAGLTDHLAPGGEGWLILSDLAEHLGLRSRAELLSNIEAAGLRVMDRIDVKPCHSKVSDTSDPLHQARSAEITSLWRLCANHDAQPRHPH